MQPISCPPGAVPQSHMPNTDAAVSHPSIFPWNQTLCPYKQVLRNGGASYTLEGPSQKQTNGHQQLSTGTWHYSVRWLQHRPEAAADGAQHGSRAGGRHPAQHCSCTRSAPAPLEKTNCPTGTQSLGWEDRKWQHYHKHHSQGCARVSSSALGHDPTTLQRPHLLLTPAVPARRMAQ